MTAKFIVRGDRSSLFDPVDVVDAHGDHWSGYRCKWC
jgi:hypothetical protein